MCVCVCVYVYVCVRRTDTGVGGIALDGPGVCVCVCVCLCVCVCVFVCVCVCVSGIVFDVPCVCRRVSLELHKLDDSHTCPHTHKYTICSHWCPLWSLSGSTMTHSSTPGMLKHTHTHMHVHICVIEFVLGVIERANVCMCV
jgi:hypothetical protein